jgi:hypothetical protein
MKALVVAIAAVTFVVVFGLVTTGGAVTSKPLVAVQVDEFSVFPGTQGAPKGKVRFVVTNIGTVKHEFVVLKTTKPAGNLLKGNEAHPKESSKTRESPVSTGLSSLGAAGLRFRGGPCRNVRVQLSKLLPR